MILNTHVYNHHSLAQNSESRKTATVSTSPRIPLSPSLR